MMSQAIYTSKGRIMFFIYWNRFYALFEMGEDFMPYIPQELHDKIYAADTMQQYQNVV